MDAGDVDELLQQMKEARFPSAWDGCRMWASGLVSWHLANRPTTWAPLQDLQDQAQTYIHHVGAVIASALHATAVEQQLDAPNGAELLAIPLAPASARLGDSVLDILVQAAPPDIKLASLLHSIPRWIDASDDSTRSKGEFIIEQARDVLVVHAEYAHAVGDRLRAVLETNQLLDDIQKGVSSTDVLLAPDSLVYERAQPVEMHMQAVNNLQAILLADQTTGTTDPGRRRDFLLQRAALTDRITLGRSERPSDDAQAQAEKVQPRPARLGPRACLRNGPRASRRSSVDGQSDQVHAPGVQRPPGPNQPTSLRLTSPPPSRADPLGRATDICGQAVRAHRPVTDVRSARAWA
ncbi:hypothetical protein [Streptomyces sp. NPDC050988]|uniref:hypothetical protein n=1 Tax=Streptomyces sp. NPDC050988 TaxID=3365637 RepID=UPI003792C790